MYKAFDSMMYHAQECVSCNERIHHSMFLTVCVGAGRPTLGQRVDVSSSNVAVLHQ